MLPRAPSPKVGFALIVGILAFSSCVDEGHPGDHYDGSSSDAQTIVEYPRLKGEYAANCTGFTQRMRDCGLLSEGPFHCAEPETNQQTCIFECFSLASCAILADVQCEGRTARVLDDCLVECNIFTCGGGDRIPQIWVCDRQADCEDASDEQGCFGCDSGAIVPPELQCDGVRDCADGSDESRCETFQCDSGQLIVQSYRCDLEADCDDGSDEENCDFFMCRATENPIFAHWQCDGEEDCLDGSDEFDCARLRCP